MIDIGNLFIFADSYGTFEGYIPEGYGAWYSTVEKPETDVTDVSQTWWHQLINSVKCNLLLNCSWSGSTICNTGYDGEDFTHMSFVGRLDKLIENKYFEKNKIDTMIILGGTNDSWADAPLGELKYSDWTKEDLYMVLPAICYMFAKIKENVKDARIICMVNSQEIKDVISESLKTVATKYGAEIIDLTNIDKTDQHPNIKGMKEIKEVVLNHLELTEKYLKA